MRSSILKDKSCRQRSRLRKQNQRGKHQRPEDPVCHRLARSGWCRASSRAGHAQTARLGLASHHLLFGASRDAGRGERIGRRRGARSPPQISVGRQIDSNQDFSLRLERCKALWTDAVTPTGDRPLLPAQRLCGRRAAFSPGARSDPGHEPAQPQRLSEVLAADAPRRALAAQAHDGHPGELRTRRASATRGGTLSRRTNPSHLQRG